MLGLSLAMTLGNPTLNAGVGVPVGFGLWKTGTQTWVFNTQRAISPTGA